ncbi:hypothetical protein FLAT13_01013 [Flavobacterium salmonis]|uniref:Conjugative transposon protein TraD n=2 Tax=Flavobacterium salmonis TaxID=2654844 RepID=A0A6V6YRZ8_9FLAO|nr:hypothetical protein FLAT13_01013 [Flavobacterium salmonis]
MGQPKPMRSLFQPKSANERQRPDPEIKTDNFDIEIDLEDFGIQIPQEELDAVFGKVPDFDDEEEEWNRYRDIDGDDSFGFAMGVTFEELTAVGSLLQQEILEPSQQNKVVKIVQKIQGTELFSLLENSVESASRKIAELLDGSLSSETDEGSSTVRKNDLEDFDIGEFV